MEFSDNTLDDRSWTGGYSLDDERPLITSSIAMSANYLTAEQMAIEEYSIDSKMSSEDGIIRPKQAQKKELWDVLDACAELYNQQRNTNAQSKNPTQSKDSPKSSTNMCIPRAYHLGSMYLLGNFKYSPHITLNLRRVPQILVFSYKTLNSRDI